MGGGVSTLFAYGQTSSGKTYTINELSSLAARGSHCRDWRRIPRSAYVCVRAHWKGSFWYASLKLLTIIVVDANFDSDLLNAHRRISILEDSFGESQLVGITEHVPSSPDALLALIETAMTFRRSAPTLKNDSSSRSHAVIRFSHRQ